MKRYTLKETKEIIAKSIDSFRNSFQAILNESESYNYHDNFLLAICKRAIDVLDTIQYAIRKYNLNTLYPLMRLQIDSCLVLQAALLYKDKSKFFSDLIEKDFQLNKYKIPKTKTRMTERKLAELLDAEFPGFLENYKYCSDFVHFTGLSFTLPTRDVEFLTFKVSDEIGNRESKYRLQFYLPNLFKINSVLLSLVNKCRNEFLPYKYQEE